MKPGNIPSLAALAAIGLAACATQAPPPAAQAPAPAPKAAAAQPASAGGGSMSGKIVWVDLKNSALLVECDTNEGCKSVEGKKGETYTLMIPDSMKGTAQAWKEGGMVKIDFVDRADGGRTLRTVTTP